MVIKKREFKNIKSRSIALNLLNLSTVLHFVHHGWWVRADFR